jgi:hypothetical protein
MVSTWQDGKGKPLELEKGNETDLEICDLILLDIFNLYDRHVGNILRQPYISPPLLYLNYMLKINLHTHIHSYLLRHSFVV